MMGHWFNGGWGGFGGYGGWWFMPIIMIVALGLIIWGIVAVVRRGGWAGGSGCCGTSHLGSDSPLDILKRRYASGEISKEELKKRKRLCHDQRDQYEKTDIPGLQRYDSDRSSCSGCNFSLVTHFFRG